MTIDPRRGLVVTAPPPSRRGWADPEARIDTFVREREPWVVRHLDRLAAQRAEVLHLGGVADGGRILYRGELHRLRFAAAATAARTTIERSGTDTGDELTVTRGRGERRSPARVLEAWFREQAADAIERSIARQAPELGVKPSAIAIRDPRSRWGSASKEGRLMFSWRLVLAPPRALETVVVHELAHLRRFGHGPGFWALVAGRVPDHAAWRAWLRRHSHTLHAALEDSAGDG